MVSLMRDEGEKILQNYDAVNEEEDEEEDEEEEEDK